MISGDRMKACISCEAEIKDALKYCPFCGAKQPDAEKVIKKSEEAIKTSKTKASQNGSNHAVKKDMPADNSQKKSSRRKIIMTIVCLVGAVALIAFIWSSMTGYDRKAEDFASKMIAIHEEISGITAPDKIKKEVVVEKTTAYLESVEKMCHENQVLLDNASDAERDKITQVHQILLKEKEVLTMLQSACKANVAENDIDCEGFLKQAGVLDSMCCADVVPEAFQKIPSLADALTPWCSTLESEKIKQQKAFVRQMDIVVEKHGKYAKKHDMGFLLQACTDSLYTGRMAPNIPRFSTESWQECKSLLAEVQSIQAPKGEAQAIKDAFVSALIEEIRFWDYARVYVTAMSNLPEIEQLKIENAEIKDQYSAFKTKYYQYKQKAKKQHEKSI